MLHIKNNIKEQMSSIAVLTEIVKNMEVPEGILTHVLETHQDNYGQDYHYDVCEFLAESIEFSDKGGFYLLGISKTLMNDAIFKKVASYESLTLSNLGLAGRFNAQRNAEIAKNYSSLLTSFCKKQSTIISEKEDDIVFSNAYKVYLKMPLNENKSIEEEYDNSLDLLSENKSIEEEYDNSLDLLRYHINLSKDIYDDIAKKHEFILNNFSYLKEILVKYFKKKQSAENLIDSTNHQNYTALSDLKNRGLNGILDGIKLLGIYSKKGEKINSKKVQETIKKIHQNYEFITIDTKGIEQEIKKLFKNYNI